MSDLSVGAARRGTVAGFAALALTLCPVAATAQDKSDTPAALAPLRACQAQEEPTARLACYDRVAAEILAASEAGDLHVVDREEVKKTRRSLFGFALPDFGIFGKKGERDEKKDEDEDEIKVLNTTIKSVGRTSDGGYLVTTAEGALWKIDNPPSRMMSPKVGQTLEIRNAALTSYFLRINGQGGVRGVRVR